jgi:hypothetical protein
LYWVDEISVIRPDRPSSFHVFLTFLTHQSTIHPFNSQQSFFPPKKTTITMTTYETTPQQQVVQQPYASQPAPVAAPPAGNDDVAHWTNRITAALNKPETITGPVPASHQPWHHRFLEFFQPIDLCMSPNYFAHSRPRRFFPFQPSRRTDLRTQA